MCSLAVVLALGLIGAAGAEAAPGFSAHGSAEQVYVTDLPADVVTEAVDALFQEATYTQLYRQDVPLGTRGAEHFWVEADVTAGIPSAKLGFNLAEFLDFLLGIGCLDMLGDDFWVKGGPAEEEGVPAFLY